MERNFYIADTHFGHANVIRFDNRPFSNVVEMEELMTMYWNAAVRPGDTVNILGDFIWGKADEWLRIVRELNGNKVLIRGNHDIKQFSTELRREFADIKEYKEIVDNGRHVLMCHYPQLFYKHSNDPFYYMLTGHVHNTPENDLLEKYIADLKRDAAKQSGRHACNLGQIINVGACMPWIGYCPRTLDEIIKMREAYAPRWVDSDFAQPSNKAKPTSQEDKIAAVKSLFGCIPSDCVHTPNDG